MWVRGATTSRPAPVFVAGRTFTDLQFLVSELEVMDAVPG